jgi:hypothetical protein
MSGGTDAADSLGQAISIAWVPALQDYLEAPKKCPGTFSVFHHAIVYHGFDGQVTFYSCDGVNLYFFAHLRSSKVIFS